MKNSNRRVKLKNKKINYMIIIAGRRPDVGSSTGKTRWQDCKQGRS
jgi:hypothetical protein